MKQLNKKALILLTSTYLISGFGIWLLIKYLFKVEVFEAYLYLPISFYAWGCVVVLILNLVNKRNQKRLVNMHMLIKVAKMMFLAIIALIYVFVLKVNLNQFLLVFATFYLFMMGCESFILISFEKLLKKLNE